ncbi:hypothetical protein [Ruminiclostridium cellobioparum]|jgi:hypothetical protein|uniref:hypothetical protein n=1 Tax=Ruminiclostridium cellobioparum TaxID=29355 RepID=UPI0028A8282E|nr:hypothetical protein [Ruminiclostridium cellobioparum]
MQRLTYQKEMVNKYLSFFNSNSLSNKYLLAFSGAFNFEYLPPEAGEEGLMGKS